MGEKFAKRGEKSLSLTWENLRSHGEKSIFNLKICIFKLKIYIFRLAICIFRLKIEISPAGNGLFPVTSGSFPPGFLYFFR